MCNHRLAGRRRELERSRRAPDRRIRAGHPKPSYAVREDGTVLLGALVQPGSGDHTQAAVFASRDGGRNWSFYSKIASSPDYNVIYPHPIALDDGRILASLCHKPTMHSAWTELYASDDGGRTWSYRSRIDVGHPSPILQLDDGRILCVYGYRQPPYGIRARLSADRGETWGDELVIRDDGVHPDLGYPRAVEIDPGRVLTTYYFNEPDPSVEGGVRHVASSTFDVPA